MLSYPNKHNEYKATPVRLETNYKKLEFSTIQPFNQNKKLEFSTINHSTISTIQPI